MTKRPLGIVFDLDGTLLDTLEDIADSMNIVLRECNLPEHPVEAFRYFVGEGASVLVRRVLPETHRDAATHAACLLRFRQVYAGRWNIKTRPYQGIPEMLREIAGRGIRMAVLSNKPHDATVQCVEEYFMSGSFDIVQGQQEGIPPKPDPGGALTIARTLGFPADRIWYLGDTATDMQTALGAGMFPLGVAWGFRTREELLEHGARVLLESPAELVPLVDGKGGA